MNTEVAQQLVRARTQLLLDQPFFGYLALRLNMVEEPGIPTCGVDGKHIFYNPAFIAKCSPGLVRAIVAHEVMHCVFDHMGRRGDRNPKKWNIAGDYVINLVLADAGFDFEGTGLFDKAYTDMTTDHVYSLLPESSGSKEAPGPGEPGGPLDDCMDGEAGSSETEATDWKIATIQAATAAQAAGKLPGSLKRFIDELTTPKVDWRERLRRFVTETAKDDYSWMRPNRRFLGQGIYLPSLHSENMGVLVNSIDTSGSIDRPTLTAFGSEITAARDSSRPTSMVNIYCDSAVNHVDEFNPNDELHFDMHGGGGTSFKPPFELVAERGIKPACFIYLTDGYGPFPDTAPDYPVLWCMTSDVVAPFGETIRIEV